MNLADRIAKNLGWAALITAGGVGAIFGIVKGVRESLDCSQITPHAIYATETVGLKDEVKLLWHNQQDAALTYNENGNYTIELYAENPLGKGLHKICFKRFCTDSTEQDFNDWLELGRKKWTELCEEVDCTGLYIDWKNQRYR